MLHRLTIAIAALMLTAALGLAEPLVRADLSLGTPRVVLEGNWAGASYNVFRSDAADAPFVPVLSRYALCTGECFAFDPEADIGASYYYRFDVIPADGAPQSFGPFLVPIGPRVGPGLHASVSPNPVRGSARFRITAARPAAPGDAAVAAARSPAQAALYDVRGRRVRWIFRGTLDRVIAEVPWDGRDEADAPVAAGTYFLRFEAAGYQAATTRVSVVR